MATEPILHVSHLTKHYGSLKAVDGISFDVQPGEVFGILGPNGAGKTTTLEMIETLSPQTSGHIVVDGFDTREKPWEVKRRIGVQLQSAGFYPELTLVDLLHLFAAMYDVDVDPMEMLGKVQLEDKARSYANKLSGGQRQRFSIATTLINTPKVIFLDEPTTGLDPQARINLWELIEQIKSTGVTIVLTTHYMDEAERLCDRLAIMDGGKIIKIGTPQGLIDNLLATGFTRPQPKKQATLEDVFIHLTGKDLREG